MKKFKSDLYPKLNYVHSRFSKFGFLLQLFTNALREVRDFFIKNNLAFETFLKFLNF